MVRAILEGRKTQMRRVIRDSKGTFWDHAGWEPIVTDGDICAWRSTDGKDTIGAGSPKRFCPPNGKPGDLLWVRETWTPSPDGIIYRATESEAGMLGPDDENVWRPSIHMRRVDSRLTLRITDVRVQKVQEISEEDARAEGFGQIGHSAHGEFRLTWDSINANRGYSWERNPWVWAISFERVP
jgi:hypothetical protein